MNLSTYLSPHFSKSIRKRGEHYWLMKRVLLEEGSAEHALARVMGSQVYAVEIALQGDTLSLWCECPYFQDGFRCKHLWATILAAQSKSYLSAAIETEMTVLEDGKELTKEGLRSGNLRPPQGGVSARRSVPKPSEWRRKIAQLTNPSEKATRSADAWPAKREILYIIDVPRSSEAKVLILALQARDRKADGALGQAKQLSMMENQLPLLPVTEDREILTALFGGMAKDYYSYSYVYGQGRPYDRVPEVVVLPHAMSRALLPLLPPTGRCFLRLGQGSENLAPLLGVEAEQWEFKLQISRTEGGYKLAGVLCRGKERKDVCAPDLIIQGGWVFTGEHVAPLAEGTAFEWILHLRQMGCIHIPTGEEDEFLGAFLTVPNLPPLEVPEELRYEESIAESHPRLKIFKPRYRVLMGRLQAELSFDYNGRSVGEFDVTGGFYDSGARRLLRRDPVGERNAATTLAELGVKLRTSYWNQGPTREVAPSKLPRIVRSLVEAGWHIEAEGKIFRQAGASSFQVSSGLDWFELHAEVNYGNCTAKLPQLLAALRRGDNMVSLDDGTYGLLPEEWLRRIGPLAGMGEIEDGHIRFQRSQAGLLDAVLATQPEARCDETFVRMRQELQRFHGLQPAEQPARFVGCLRGYQCEGLGWMHFLRRFSFGGCLADDMGVGKTAQVLALLETRRELRAAGEPIAPSLVVVPRSLVFNWKQEAARFTPGLRVLDYSGITRNGEELTRFDVILATYGTLRRDALRLKEIEFDYIILDEAQAAKNADTETSKAVRVLRGTNRLALSGTPVENHLGELWTLFEFLNPGMLGAANAFKLAGGAMRNPSEESRQLLARALRPFILRRTKEQVARELPPKSEQTVYCELEPEQRSLYNELREHYRNRLLKRIQQEGLVKSKIQVLEALLRLRQAACHPGLLDPKRTGDSSAKLQVLLEQLREVLDEGHKALVFSQFTSLLKIVRQRLDFNGMAYEYLDGATRNRRACVERFQNDSDCRIFLVSLKAGGLGLNLTAAEYVFILDPWWNPAVEAQAVDRAHRIGQSRKVFAYRLIARETIEEKVLQLQNSKRDLAAAIIGADNSLIRNLRPEDLEILLS